MNPKMPNADNAPDDAGISAQGVPERLGRYQVKRLMGKGGMGRVFYAIDTELERPVALKVINPALIDNPDIITRFRQEAKAVARLNHPNIVQIYEFAQEGDLPFFAMEFVDGMSLTAWLNKSGALALNQAVRLALAAVNALDYALKRDVIHRDVKPENMLVSREGRLKLVDFGLAKCLEANSELTQSGTVVGSPYYMSPEQSKGEKADHRSDMYALGISLFHMLTAKRPFEASSPVAILLKHVSEPLPEPPELQQLLEGRVLAVVKRMTAKNPEERYPDYKSLRHDLRALIQGGLLLGEGKAASASSTTSASGANTLVSPPPAPTPAPGSASAIVPDIGSTIQSTPVIPTGATVASSPRGPGRAIWVGAALIGIVAALGTGVVIWRLMRRDMRRSLAVVARQAQQNAPTPSPLAAPPTPLPAATPQRPTPAPPAADRPRQGAERWEAMLAPVRVDVRQMRLHEAVDRMKSFEHLYGEFLKRQPQERLETLSHIRLGLEAMCALKDDIVRHANESRDSAMAGRFHAAGRNFMVRADKEAIWFKTPAGTERRQSWADMPPVTILLMGARIYGRAPDEQQARRLRVFAAAFRLDIAEYRILPPEPQPSPQERELLKDVAEFVGLDSPPGGARPLIDIPPHAPADEAQVSRSPNYQPQPHPTRATPPRRTPNRSRPLDSRRRMPDRSR